MGNKSHTPELTQRILDKERLARKSMSTEWTNEKHSLYLKSMEASFVKDLYGSFNMFGYQIMHPSDPKLPKEKHDASRSFGQFKVLRRGCWQKLNFERNRPQSVKADGPNVLLANPWIRHCRSSHARERVESSSHHENIALVTDFPCYDSVEVTDQNFVEEEDMEEIISHKKIKIETSMAPIQIYDRVSCDRGEISSHKKIKSKTWMSPASINDQVVPLAKFSVPIGVNR